MRNINKKGLLVFSLLVFDIISSYVFMTLVERNVGRGDREMADAAIVLFSGFDGTTHVNSETMRRIDHTVNLYQKGLFRNIMCVGGARSDRNLYGAKLMKGEFVSRGVPSDRIYFEKRSNDTLSNLTEAFNAITEYKWKNAVIISSPLHIFRVKWILSSHEKEVSVSFSPYSYADSIPEISLPRLWMQVHYEWVAYALLTILPANLYENIIDAARS
jgi:uncharacterized SAM-binding protein YcdF (DUF218 family)